MAKAKTVGGIIIGAPHSGSGKTTITLGLAAALRQTGKIIAPAKTGPDYIDTAFLSAAAAFKAINLDPWAMSKNSLSSRAASHSAKADLLLVEGVMGLFDGAASGSGSTADLAATLRLPIILVVDVARQSQSVGALVWGFANWRKDINIAGVILNNVGSYRHETLLRKALAEVNIPVLGALPRDNDLKQPQRHLGLLLPSEINSFDAFVGIAAKAITDNCDLNKILELGKQAALAQEPVEVERPKGLAPLGQNIAIAKDAAFAFIYQHWLDEWRLMGANISFFSPLANEAVPKGANAVFLPGGYPELHAQQLANCSKFFMSLAMARDRSVLIYGECGGYMVLGKTLTDKHGISYKMSGLLPHITSIDKPRRVLGYRCLSHKSPLPWSKNLSGHEFHYSTGTGHDLPPLFSATDANGIKCQPMGAVLGRVMGSYAHVIDNVPMAGGVQNDRVFA